MTLIEKVRKEHPDEMNSFDRPVYCPTKYGYAGQPSYCGDIDYGDANKRCTECWNREIPEVDDDTMEAVVEDLKNPVTDIPEEVIDKFNSVGNPYPITSEDTRKILDSGNRRQFASGAVRDIQEGKGRCDLMPLDVVAEYLTLNSQPNVILSCIHAFQTDGNCVYLFKGLDYFNEHHWNNNKTMILEVSKHFEDGANKYGENNWQKGIPVHCYINSAVRHYLKFLRGDNDEPHDRAFVWNIMCAIWTCKHKPELNEYERKETHNG